MSFRPTYVVPVSIARRQLLAAGSDVAMLRALALSLIIELEGAQEVQRSDAPIVPFPIRQTPKRRRMIGE